MKKLLLFIILFAALTGCATIFTGTTQSVVFSAPAGTSFYLDGIKVAEIPSGYDSVSVILDRNLGGLNMIAKKPGYRDTYFRIGGKVNGVVFVNILLGPAFWIGGIVDVATGATIKYPNYIMIEMEPLERTVIPAAGRDTSLDHLLQL